MGAGSESATQDCMPEEAEFSIDGSAGRFANESQLLPSGDHFLGGSSPNSWAATAITVRRFAETRRPPDQDEFFGSTSTSV